MITEQTFKDEFENMARLCGFTVTGKTYQPYYSKLKYEDIGVISRAFSLITDDPPNKLNLKNIKSFISIEKNKDGDSTDWNGQECEYCERGLIHTVHGGYNYVWRCTYCNSSNLNIEFHTPENVLYLEGKLRNLGILKDKIESDEQHRNSEVGMGV